MKEIPILFSTPMVQAKLDKRKTMTRRLIKPQPWSCEQYGGVGFAWSKKGPESSSYKWNSNMISLGNHMVEDSPYGQPGDLLWVRETWNPWYRGDGTELIEYAADGVRRPIKHVKKYDNCRRRPGIHMNKEYSRIWLQKTAGKIERACNISREDAIAEGLACITKDGGRTYKYGIPDRDGYPGTDDHGWPWHEWEVNPVAAFKKLWCKINGPETWESWVWVESFKVLSTTCKPDLQTT